MAYFYKEKPAKTSVSNGLEVHYYMLDSISPDYSSSHNYPNWLLMLLFKAL